MILRVWALYNQSRLVLGALLGLYTVEVILLFVRYLLVSISVGSGSASKPNDFVLCMIDRIPLLL